jgi:hypothetical protein
MCVLIGGIMMKDKKYFEWAISFWIGIGLMSIINVWKIIYTKQTLSYNWIMFGVSIIFILICVVLIRLKKSQK